MTTALVTGLLAGWAIAVPVGAIAAYLVSLTSRTSLAVGAAAAIGVATVDGGYAAVAALGGRSLVPVLGSVATPLRLAAGVILLGLAGRSAWSAVRDHRAGATPTPAGGPAAAGPSIGTDLTRPARAYWRFVALTAVNPATVIYFTALVIGSRKVGSVPIAEGGLFALAAFAASASWQLTLAAGGAVLGRLLTGRTGRLSTALISSAVIAAFGAILLWSG